MFYQHALIPITLICSAGLLGAVVIASICHFRYNRPGIYVACGAGMLFVLALSAQIGNVTLFLLALFTLFALFRFGLDLLRPPAPHVFTPPRMSRYVRLQQNGG